MSHEGPPSLGAPEGLGPLKAFPLIQELRWLETETSSSSWRVSLAVADLGFVAAAAGTDAAQLPLHRGGPEGGPHLEAPDMWGASSSSDEDDLFGRRSNTSISKRSSSSSSSSSSRRKGSSSSSSRLWRRPCVILVNIYDSMDEERDRGEREGDKGDRERDRDRERIAVEFEAKFLPG